MALACLESNSDVKDLVSGLQGESQSLGSFQI